ncbi:succinylglutamate-semialdehyde dehydrogenase [Novosphingobium sp. Gsoil 351]|uniref:succinylglutamate-semialdehyde dehydrogenase n=1 Tax=Novosphingobium sp. Gsoil 351 TaxID=2675225 RepID=UPI0012B4B591|nr:succinylglutamate-semialdehyde dehydrogenase [Novosphingobium sp. Gsoil 351]QGN54487.1 succinylglutamate-semialdehyde dehydrogenase [Novosphingobium sp. Gsoil 351]
MILRSFDPALGEELWQGDVAPAEACAAAVARARQALPLWSRRPLAERVDILEGYAAKLKGQDEAMALRIAREAGKPLWEARTEVAAMIGKVALSVAALHERAGEREAATDFGVATLRHRPHGVMAVLGPFNFPGHLPNGHIVPALLAGNCVVFKPSEQTPWVGQAMVEMLWEAGVPGDVVQIVHGGRETGGALVACDVDGVLFTGSARAGRFLRRTLIDRPEVILALELGGNNPLVAWDGDPALAAEVVVQSAFITAGQRCTCARRLIVPQGGYGDQMVAALSERIAALRIGAWNDFDQPFMGPVISSQAARAAHDAQTALVAAGSRSLVPLEAVPNRSEAFVSPGLIDSTGVDAADEEIFAPLLQVIRAPDFPQAIELANRTRFGLAAGLISDDPGLWDQFRRSIRAGVVNRNRPTTGASGAMPFGGLGESGNHRPSGFYAADYCAHPVAGLEAAKVHSIPTLPGSGSAPVRPGQSAPQ